MYVYLDTYLHLFISSFIILFVYYFNDFSILKVIIGAMLHDIGHLLGNEQGLTRMETGGVILGAANHETLGEKFLLDLGLPETVCKLVRGHVDAKRYLVYKNEDYRKSTC